ncbi:hypothetical protein BCR35DRAFT_332748 [Leucosporidium creatinivorum]|uniref:Uncharacterized protein n=1 Tax=Leucosporidium creatinivorum TaxID=106004 RepID=A0A1Y2EZD8_9BASI|nr:hypothetical protein BCR35DRAFT_332748 [Leucosporidium creatinivorum]
MTCAVEQAISASPYASKPIWELLSPAPSYSEWDNIFLGDFLEWVSKSFAPHMRLAPGDLEYELEHRLDLAFPRLEALERLHETEGAPPSPPKYKEEWNAFYEQFVRYFLNFEGCKELLHAQFTAVYQHLRTLPHLVPRLDIKGCAIVWKAFYQGWSNLDSWQTVQTRLLQQHMGLSHPFAHSLARNVHFPEKREQRESKTVSVWQDEMRRQWA